MHLVEKMEKEYIPKSPRIVAHIHLPGHVSRRRGTLRWWLAGCACFAWLGQCTNPYGGEEDPVVGDAAERAWPALLWERRRGEVWEVEYKGRSIPGVLLGCIEPSFSIRSDLHSLNITQQVLRRYVIDICPVFTFTLSWWIHLSPSLPAILPITRNRFGKRDS